MKGRTRASPSWSSNCSTASRRPEDVCRTRAGAACRPCASAGSTCRPCSTRSMRCSRCRTSTRPEPTKVRPGAAAGRRCRASPATRSSRCSAAAAWAWSTRARHLRLDRTIALKMLLARRVRGSRAARALRARGRRSSQGLRHAHIVASARHRRARRQAVLHDGVHGGRQPRAQACGQAAARAARHGADDHAGGGHARGSCGRRGSPRSQAGQRSADGRRHAEDLRLRPRPPHP